ncbi:alpha/beta hydrolase [Streptomyces sp. HNM0574]|uniref:alpha/beta hydrolase n=1 Tax=Streptomyces sp. HNM0574 TaxID=2714954 RepID=UPI00146BF7BF|nr:alpha/beta hydrolase [Streptomyces sp. HNM0574]NLU67274.1 alpha/beta hydrolase [Streptomyces sp. HNM0574]
MQRTVQLRPPPPARRRRFGPRSRRRGAAALACAVTLSALAAAGCGGDGEGDGGSGIRTAARTPAAEDGTGASPREAPTGSPSSSLPNSLTGQRPDWSPCPAPDAAQGTSSGKPAPLPDGTKWECASLTVPLDYAEPDGKTIRTEMIRAKKADNDRPRLGSLLFNFGGPGSSGVASLPSFGEGYGKLRGQYDLVSFDPRGVGRSEGVECGDGPELDAYFAADWTPDSGKEEKALTERQGGFARGCDARSGELLPHLTTENTARDMDLMRQVLGDDKLHYFGFSYGTELGGVYAHLFPQKVGRAVFDAVVDPTASAKAGSSNQARGFQRALRNYLQDCVGKDGCPLGKSPQEGEKRIGKLLDGLDRKPIPAGAGRELTESLATNGMAQALYSKELWRYLTEGLRDAMDKKDGTTLLVLADALNGRNQDGSYSTLQSSLTAISCADSKARYDTGDVREALPDFTAASPLFGPSAAWGLTQCDGWPVRGKAENPDVSAKGSDPILLVGTTGDPATPYEGTRRMKEQLGEDVAVEVTYRGEGHGAYDTGNRCVRQKVDAYLLKGEAPKDGSTCTGGR